VPGREQRDERLVEQRVQLDVRAGVEPVDRQERHVERVGVQVLEHHLARLLAHDQLDAGVACVVGGEQRGQVEAPGRPHRPDHDAAGADAGQLGQLGGGGVDLGQRAPRPRHQQFTGGGQRDVARGAVDQRHADLVLEPPDLLGERRLGDVEPRGSPREVALVGERDEVAQLAQLHGDYLSESDVARLGLISACAG
jgi:hypothetical protein